MLTFNGPEAVKFSYCWTHGRSHKVRLYGLISNGPMHNMRNIRFINQKCNAAYISAIKR